MRNRWDRPRLVGLPRLRVGLLALAGLALSACAPEMSTKSLVKTCKYSSDQSGTFLGNWYAHAVPIAFAAGNFSSAEKQEILAAIKVWNDFHTTVRSHTIFDPGDGSEAAQSSPPGSICSAGPVIQNGQFVDRVVIYKRASGWPYGAAAAGVTSTCPSGNGAFYNAQVELNYQHFFGSNQPRPDLATMLVHELGHLSGLDHSCEASPSKSGMPNCTSSSLPVEYFDAVMYPAMNFVNGVGAKKTALGKNDQGRANCLKW